jgi:hypothetical protein
MYSRITKTYDSKTAGYIFMKPVQTEGTTQTFFSQEVFFHHSSHFYRWVSVQAEIKWSPINS